MIALLKIMSSSLAELDLGLRGDLTISASMEVLMNSLFDAKVPGTWEVAAWPSLRLLASWLGDLQRRCQKLHEWTADLQLPKVPPPHVQFQIARFSSLSDSGCRSFHPAPAAPPRPTGPQRE
jgi:hypothetical protein